MKKYSALFVIFGSALWGTDALFRRPLTAAFSPITIVLLEHCILSIAVIPIIVRLRREFRILAWRDCACLLFIALGGSVTATILFTFSMKYGNPSVVILLQKTQPLFTVLLARLTLGERPAKWFWPWFAAAIAGALLLSTPVWPPGLHIEAWRPAVVLSAIAAAALWGSATVCGRFIVARISTPFLTALRFAFALPALAVLYRLQPIAQRELPAALPAIASIIAMALIPGLAALLLYYKGLKATTASLASVCELAFPVTAVAVNWLVLNIGLTSIQLLGSVILVIAVTSTALLGARENRGHSPTSANRVVMQ